MKKEASKTQFDAVQQAELAALAILPDEEINLAETPEQTDWSGARRGVFFRPVKEQLTLRLDADLVAWFKNHTPNGKAYQASINSALREYVVQHDKPQT